MTKLWIVGKYVEGAWDFMGIFDSEAQAVAVAIRRGCFVAPAILNQVVPLETTEWPGCYCPGERMGS